MGNHRERWLYSSCIFRGYNSPPEDIKLCEYERKEGDTIYVTEERAGAEMNMVKDVIFEGTILKMIMDAVAYFGYIN